MIEKRKCILFVCILIVFIGGIFVMVIQNKNNYTEVKPFDYNDYQYYIDNFPSNENIGNVFNAKDAATKAETIWIKTYGERIKKEKPYQVFFDTENGIWLIQGFLQPNMMGGVANILIENESGRVLAIWHDK